MKGNFWRMSLAAALTLTGIAVTSPQKAANAAILKDPIKRVQINYLPGKGVKVWTNYEGGQLINFRAENKSKWNVVETAVDRKGKLWYKIGYSEWIEARYTIDLDEKKAGSAARSREDAAIASVKANKKNKKTKKEKAAKTKVPKERDRATVSKASTKAKAAKPSPAVVTTAAKVTANNAQRAQAVVNMAKSEIGKGYVWGGNGPDNFDCSGLVQYIYNKVGGVNLPRVTTDQVKVGTAVQMNQLQPGDLLYWGSTDAPYHIGIYVGNNQYVSAATPEQGVVLQTISSYFYPCIAKRVL